MNSRRVTLAGLVLVIGTMANAKEYSNGDNERLLCYQNGQLVFKTTERVRDFQPTSAMTLLADVSVGQVQETTHKLYASDQAGLVCVLNNKK